jgi:hypothetical protein
MEDGMSRRHRRDQNLVPNSLSPMGLLETQERLSYEQSAGLKKMASGVQ